jgi:hypothetical protein
VVAGSGSLSRGCVGELRDSRSRDHEVLLLVGGGCQRLAVAPIREPRGRRAASAARSAEGRSIMPRQSRLTTVRLGQPPVRVAIYTRRSTGEKNQPFTIEVQESKLAAYVASQECWTIVARFTDDASGATTGRRGLGPALAAARAGQFDVLLICW